MTHEVLDTIIVAERNFYLIVAGVVLVAVIVADLVINKGD